jgi:hypothetical protein
MDGVMGYSRRNVILGSIAALLTGIAAPIGIATVTKADGDRRSRRGRSGDRHHSSRGSERSSNRSHAGASGSERSSGTRNAGRGDDDSDGDDDDRRRARDRNTGECRVGRFPDWRTPKCRKRFQASM